MTTREARQNISMGAGPKPGKYFRLGVTQFLHFSGARVPQKISILRGCPGQSEKHIEFVKNF